MRRRALGASILLGLLASGCSFTPEDAAEPLAERAIENRIENELGEDVDLDLDDEGSITLEGSQGGSDFRIELDPETREIRIIRDGEESSVSLDRENGSITIEDAEGTSQDLDIPDLDVPGLDSGSAELSDWPDDVPLPDGQVLDTAVADDEFARVITLSIAPLGDPTALLENYRDQLVAEGFELTEDTSSEDSGFANRTARLSRDQYSVMIAVVDGGAVQLATVSLAQPT